MLFEDNKLTKKSHETTSLRYKQPKKASIFAMCLFLTF